MCHKLSFALLFAVLTFGQKASAQLFREKICDSLNIQSDIRWPEFSGIWYEHSRYPDLMEFGEKCVFRNYFNIKDGRCGIIVAGLLESNQTFATQATGSLGPGYVDFKYANGVRQQEQILGTDYKSWAAIYSCTNVGGRGAEKAWILTRERNADPRAVVNAEAMLTRNNVLTKNLRDTMQKGCTN